MNVVVKAIPHKKQRYATCGDWFFDAKGVLRIFVSQEMSEASQQLVILHELAEVIMCRSKGITQKSVDQFDMEYERNRASDDDSEPGDHPHAPYQEQHNIATGIERIVCAAMGVAWRDHDQEVGKLFE